MGRDYQRLAGDGGGGISSSKSKRKANGVNGCMAAFYHLFDFPSRHHNNHTIDTSSRSKGLKLIEESLPSTTYKDKQSLNISVSMRVRTEMGTTSSRLRALVTDTSTSSSEICNSPGGSKTPNLVARLMGLDLLPDLNHSLTNLDTMSTSHGSSRLESHRLSKKGTRSLPVSPRISSARKSDFDIHRLSLQLNKESSNKHEEFRCSRLKQDQEEDRSPRVYARRIVKEIKERVVTRRVIGTDIINLVKNREARPSHELRRDTTVSCSPRTRFSEKENKPNTIHKPKSSSSFRSEQKTEKAKPTRMILVSVSKASEEKQSQNRVKQKQLQPINQCKKAETETRRPIKPSPTKDIRIKKREAFLSESRDVKAKPLHKKKLKKIQNSNDLENISVTVPPQKQIEKSSPQEARNRKLEDAATITREDYITRIMNLAGIKTDSPATMLSPWIFGKLEHFGDYSSGTLALQCNRRLLFDLVNEILIENYNESELIRELSSAVESYHRKCCTAPEEIALKDVEHLVETKKKNLEEEGEEIVGKIEREIIDALVGETVSELRSETTWVGKMSN
ncbi:hypothetical protein V5N11_014088 [Cardamine amara subsp. amara]|uniref:DUF3741 domain-containing protein n=1 Tax=Cardamine amara subsp. amara TaxID=228776 RepID=A0ABD1AMT0_CARAN